MKTLSIYDVDETLFQTTATVKVVEEGWVVDSLSNSDFNTHNLESTQSYDFSEFFESRLFYDRSRPIPNMIDRLKKEYRDKDKSDKIIILTARSDMDDKYLYMNKFKDHGIPIEDIHIYRAGNLTCKGSVAYKKALVIKEYLEQTDFSNVYMYDDSVSNLNSFLDLDKVFPHVSFCAYLVAENGNAYQHTLESPIE